MPRLPKCCSSSLCQVLVQILGDLPLLVELIYMIHKEFKRLHQATGENDYFFMFLNVFPTWKYLIKHHLESIKYTEISTCTSRPSCIMLSSHFARCLLEANSCRDLCWKDRRFLVPIQSLHPLPPHTTNPALTDLDLSPLIHPVKIKSNVDIHYIM